MNKLMLILFALSITSTTHCYKFYIVNDSSKDIITQLYIVGQAGYYGGQRLVPPGQYALYDSSILCGSKVVITFWEQYKTNLKMETINIPGTLSCHMYQIITVKSDSYNNNSNDTSNVSYEAFIFDTEGKAQKIEERTKSEKNF